MSKSNFSDSTILVSDLGLKPNKFRDFAVRKYVKHNEKLSVAERSKKWKNENSDKYAARMKKYYTENKDIINKKKRDAYAAKKAVKIGQLSKEDIEELNKKFIDPDQIRETLEKIRIEKESKKAAKEALIKEKNQKKQMKKLRRELINKVKEQKKMEKIKILKEKEEKKIASANKVRNYLRNAARQSSSSYVNEV
jgi:hypothetical protein